MDIKKIYGYAALKKNLRFLYKNLDDTYDPWTVPSIHFKHWHANITNTTCSICLEQNGKIYGLSDENILKPPAHTHCKCTLIPLEAIVSGNATKDGENGADFWIKYYGKLPDYYASEQAISNLGWKRGKSPKKFAPGKMITRGVYQNENKYLPDKPDRIWYEADINYYEGKRNKHRLLWSNDGLIFVTYDHYETFYEII